MALVTVGDIDAAHVQVYPLFNALLLAGPRVEESTALDLKPSVSCAITR